MMNVSQQPSRGKSWLLLCLLSSLLVASGLACGFGPSGPRLPYTAAFGSTGYCQTPGHQSASAEILTTVVLKGPNITLCHFNPGTGQLQGHQDLTVHGDALSSANGLLYVAERGGSDGHNIALCAVDMRNGQQHWCQPHMQDPITGSVAFYSYFSTSFLSENGTVYMMLRFGPSNSINSRAIPTATTSSPVHAFSPTPTVSSPSFFNMLFALNEADGRIVWRSNLGDPVAGPQRMPLRLDHGTLYVQVGGRDSRVCALRAKTGKQIWCHVFPHPFLVNQAVAGGLLYVRTADAIGGYLRPSDDTNIDALDAATGVQIWEASLHGVGGLDQAGIEVAEGVVYASISRCRCESSPDTAEEIFAFDASTGAKRWTTIISQFIFSLVGTSSVLYVADQDGRLTAVRASDGTQLWKQRPKSSAAGPISSLLIDHQTIYAAPNNTYVADALASIDARSGQVNWLFNGCDFSGFGDPSSSCYWKDAFPDPAIVVLLPA